MNNKAAPHPFALSSKAIGPLRARSWFDAPKEIPIGGKLTTNGGMAVSVFDDLQ